MSYSNLFVAKLPRNLNDADLEQIFADYRPVSAKVMLDASTGKSKGFGFVLFATEEEGRRAYDALNRKSARTARHHFSLVIYPSQHTGRAVVAPSTALYIRNIPIAVPRAEVEKFLAGFGVLTYCAMREDHYGNPVWVVYAEYDCLECSKNALQHLHGNADHFSGPPVMVKYADSDEAKQERRRRREEGKVAPAPVPRNVGVFPPPRHAAAADMRPGSSVDAAAVAAPPLKSGSLAASNCSRGMAVSVDSATQSLGPYQSSDTSSTASSVYKVLDNVFAPTVHQRVDAVPPSHLCSGSTQSIIPSMYPVDRPAEIIPPSHAMVHQTNGNKEAPPVVVMLKNGQQLLLAPNAVNVRPADFAPPKLAIFYGLMWA